MAKLKIFKLTETNRLRHENSEFCYERTVLINRLHLNLYGVIKPE